MYVFNIKDTMAETEVTKTLVVQNKMGIHARPAAAIVRVSNKYSSTELWVEKDGEEVNGKSIMSLMMLAAGKGSQVKFIANGADAEEMIAAIEELFNNIRMQKRN